MKFWFIFSRKLCILKENNEKRRTKEWKTTVFVCICWLRISKRECFYVLKSMLLFVKGKKNWKKKKNEKWIKNPWNTKKKKKCLLNSVTSFIVVSYITVHMHHRTYDAVQWNIHNLFFTFYSKSECLKKMTKYL